MWKSVGFTFASSRMPSRLPAWSGSSESCLKTSSDQISSSIGPSSGIQGKDPEGVYDPAPKGVPAGGTSKSSKGSLAGPDPAGESREASAGSTPEVIKAGTLKRGPPRLLQRSAPPVTRSLKECHPPPVACPCPRWEIRGEELND